VDKRIKKLLETNLICKGAKALNPIDRKVSSGISIFDKYLGGWPLATITELIHDEDGLGEISILIPLLSKISNSEKNWIVLINPPYIPYAPSMNNNKIDTSKILIVKTNNAHEVLWSMEQSLKTKNCSVVIGWPKILNENIIRRLSKAARQGATMGFYLVNSRISPKNSSVPYRFKIDKKLKRTRISVLKHFSGIRIKNFTINDALVVS
tara:strand:- start:10 stop:636 length:627 start_codon:yes stop_codon:yes gene_type:complete